MDRQEALLNRVNEILQRNPVYEPPVSYNIFDVLEVGRKEVIMCRFLADLLNPEGAHQAGTLFLRTFLTQVLKLELGGETLLRSTRVVTEYVIDEARRIDIVIQNSRYFIPIEVKIYAGEQQSQCYDYYECAVRHDPEAKVVYLTRFGTPPSEYSRKKKADDLAGKSATEEAPETKGIQETEWTLSLDKIKCISWGGDIREWLAGLLPELRGETRQIVMQYMDVIHGFAEERDVRIMRETTELLLESQDYFSAGVTIERQMKRAKLALIQRVFEEFERQMKPVAEKYGLEPETTAEYYSYRDSSHEKFYDSYSTYPGLNYVVRSAHFKNEHLQMWFRIEVEHNLFAGFALFDTARRAEAKYNGYQVAEVTSEMREEAAQFVDADILNPEDWWLVYCYPNGKRIPKTYADVPNFKEMNACAAALVDEEKRKEFVREAIGVFERELLGHLVE